MKRHHSQQQESCNGSHGHPSTAMAGGSKGKEPLYNVHHHHHHQQQQQQQKQHKDSQGVDKELADMGYCVKSSDLMQVAQRLEQLEMVMCSAQEDGISHLSSEAVHYNPSDLAGWIESMLTELNVPVSADLPVGPSEAGLDQSCRAATYLTREPSNNSVPESSTSTSRDARSGQKVDPYLAPGAPEVEVGVGVGGLYEPDVGLGVGVGLDESGFLEGYSLQHYLDGGGGFVDQMAGLFSHNSDPSAILIPGSANSSLEIQSTHLMQPQQQPQPQQQSQPQQHQRQQQQQQQSQDEPSTILIPTSSNSSLEVQSKDQILQQQQQQNQQQQQQQQPHRRDKKRLRPEETEDEYLQAGSSSSAPAMADRPMVMGADPQESGVILVHTLMGCAEAVHQNNIPMAGKMVKQIRILASTQGGAMGKVATYFAEALARRIYGFLPQDTYLLNQNDPLSDILQFHFYETCPYLKFAHFTANQAILEAFSGHKKVHVIDFNLKQGMQWPALIQALALRSGGPPAFKLTGIGPRQQDGTDALNEVGLKLAHLAESINVEFSFRGYVVSNLSELKSWMLDLAPGVEAVAVNSIFQLHRLLYDSNSDIRPQPRPRPRPRPSSAIDEVLASVRSLNPTIVTMVEQEADHNRPIFLERFTEALHYYSTMFDSLEACRLPPQSEDQVMSEIYLGREICNIVACEGSERVERHETLMQWRVRMYNAGFQAMHLGSNAFKQASMLLTLFPGGEGYKVEENNGCLTLGWHSRPLIAASAWQCR
eukprot:Gb_13966 [translate_table: standard]